MPRWALVFLALVGSGCMSSEAVWWHFLDQDADTCLSRGMDWTIKDVRVSEHTVEQRVVCVKRMK